jgi:glycosyltransferase involved in cell wall biosynthesis
MRIGVNCLPLQKEMGGVRQDFQRLFRELLATDFESSYVFFYAERNREELAFIGSDRWRDGAIMVGDDGEILPHLMKVDLFYSPFNYLWPRPLPVASVVKLADIQEAFYPQFFDAAALEFRRIHFPASTRAADSVITVSDFSKQTIASQHRIDPGKIFVAPHVADAAFFTPAREDAVTLLRLPERFIFYPANHWPHKNHDGLLRALAHLKQERGVELPCVLTGFSHGYPLQEKIAQYGLCDQVKVVGYVSQEEIRGIYHKATMLCFPSLFEGFGMPIIEAMASSCPVVCSNAASIPEVAGEAAIFFDPQNPRDIAEKLLTLWENRALRERLVLAGKERVRLFTAARMVDAHKQAFSAAVESFHGGIRLLYEQNLYQPLEQLQRKAQELDAVQSSLSWKLTAPLRKLGRFIRRD